MQWTHTDNFKVENKIYVANINNQLVEFKFHKVYLDFKQRKLCIELITPNGIICEGDRFEFANSALDYVYGKTYKARTFEWLTSGCNKDSAKFVIASRKSGFEVDLLYTHSTPHLIWYEMENCKVVMRHCQLRVLCMGRYDLINDEFDQSFLMNFSADDVYKYKVYPTKDACINAADIQVKAFPRFGGVVKLNEEEIDFIKDCFEYIQFTEHNDMAIVDSILKKING